jgi:hypothetical protein
MTSKREHHITPWKTITRSGRPDMVYEARAEWLAGRRCPTDCWHDPPCTDNTYGNHCDEAYLVVRSPQADAHGRCGALSVLLFLGSYKQERREDYFQRTTGSSADLHVSFWTEEGDVRAASKSTKCEWIVGGRCYAAKSGGMVAVDVWGESNEALDPHLTEPGSDVAKAVVALQTGAWDRAIDLFDDWYSDAIKEAEALPRRCEHCGGGGTLPYLRQTATVTMFGHTYTMRRDWHDITVWRDGKEAIVVTSDHDLAVLVPNDLAASREVLSALIRERNKWGQHLAQGVSRG